MSDHRRTPPARVYLDAASTEPLRPAARIALLEALEQGWADPTRLHTEARLARAKYDEARETVAGVLGCRADEVSFVSSGTEAVHRGLTGLLLGRRRHGPVLVHSAVEHSSVLQTAAHHVSAGGETRPIGVSSAGAIDLAELETAVRGAGVLAAAVQSGNLESAALQPTAEIAGVCSAAEVPWFCDLAATTGRLDPVPGWSVGAASAHKWGGPAGVGVLGVRKNARWRAPGPSDGRVDRRSPGFENIPGILGAAAALAEMESNRAERSERQRALTERIGRVAGSIPDVEVIGGRPGHPGVPHVVSLSFLYVDGESLVTELDRRGFAVDSGSACSASSLEPSHVLAAMGVLTHGNVRVSVTDDTTVDEVDRFLGALSEVVAEVRARLAQ